MNGNSSIKMEGIHVADLANRKKPKTRKVTITVIAEDELNEEVYLEVDDWLATLTLKEILESVKEAIKEIK